MIEVAASPSWPLSNSRRTRSRAASRTRSRSSSASFFIASRRTFCRLMSPIWVTVQHADLRHLLHSRTGARFCQRERNQAGRRSMVERGKKRRDVAKKR